MAVENATQLQTGWHWTENPRGKTELRNEQGHILGWYTQNPPPRHGYHVEAFRDRQWLRGEASTLKGAEQWILSRI